MGGKPIKAPGLEKRAPTDLTLSNQSVAENADGAILGILNGIDPDQKESFVFTVPATSEFEVVDINGQSFLKLKQGVSFNYETTPEVQVDVTITDSKGLTHTRAFTIIVNDVNERPTDIVLSSASVEENATGAVIGVLSGSDPESDELSFSVVGPEASRFEAVQDPTSGSWSLQLQAGVSLNYEEESSTDVLVQVSDEISTRQEVFNITVNDVPEPAPIVREIDTYPDFSLSFASGIYSPVGEVSGDNPGIQIETNHDFATYFAQSFVAIPGLAEDLTFRLSRAPGTDGIDFRVLITTTTVNEDGSYTPADIVYQGPLMTLGPQLGTSGIPVTGPDLTVSLGGIDLVDGATYAWVVDTVSSADSFEGYGGLIYRGKANPDLPGNSSVLVWDLEANTADQPWINTPEIDLAFRMGFSEGGVASPVHEVLGTLPAPDPGLLL